MEILMSCLQISMFFAASSSETRGQRLDRMAQLVVGSGRQRGDRV